MANKSQGASLNPADLGTGGNIDDGRYTITGAQVILMDTSRGEKCAVEFPLRGSGGDQSQRYTVGPSEKFQPSDDGNEIITEAKISPKSNFGKFLKAVANAGFPPNEMGSDVRCFVNADLDFVNVAQPVEAGQDDKSLPLPSKYYGKAKGGKSRPSAPAGRSTTGAKPAAPSSAPSTDNGDLDSEAIIRVQEALTNAKDNTLTRVKLQLAVWGAATKAKDASASEYRKLAGNVEWLEANSEAGSWMVDGDNITLAS